MSSSILEMALQRMLALISVSLPTVALSPYPGCYAIMHCRNDIAQIGMETFAVVAGWAAARLHAGRCKEGKHVGLC